MLRSAFHVATSGVALGALLAMACGEEHDGGDDGAGTAGQADAGASGASAGQGGTNAGSAGSAAGKGGSANTGGRGGSADTGGRGGTTASGGTGGSGTSAGAGGSDASGAGGRDDGGAGAASGGTSGMNDCDPRKIMCRRSAPVCDEGEAPSVEGICYGPCVPIASCACNSAEACPLPEMFTCHLSRGRCDYYVR